MRKEPPRKAAAPSRKPDKSLPAGAASTSKKHTQLQTEQRELQQRLTKLKRELATVEATHSEATDGLRASEAEISTVNRRLRELAQARELIERQIRALQDRGRAVVARQTEQERQLGVVMRTQFALSRQTPWQRLLDSANPNQLGRDKRYLDYIVTAKAQLVSELRARREELDELEAQSRVQQIELSEIAADEQSNREQLLKQQALRKKTLGRMAKQITAQKQSIATLERDERRLGTLIERLAKVLQEQASKRRRESTVVAAPAATASRPSPSGQAEVELPSNSNFVRLRGRLALPVKGELAARFGSPRRTEAGVDAPTWKGVFIRAGVGADVHSLAAGRVIFADWLRGFGNLLIIDHGEGFISVYGNNETLLRNVGDPVAVDEAVATVGNTGGNADAGLYFELRYQGRPLDPLRWASARQP